MIGCHCHTDKSNIRLLDSTNSVGELLKTAVQMNYKGLAITDHEVLSAHLEAIKTVREMKKKGDMPADFKLILGNEAYLVDSLEEVRDNYKSGQTKFPHFLMLAIDPKGHEQLRILSSQAWENSFYTGTMERVPTVKKDVEELLSKDPGHIIATTACLGSEVNINLLRIKECEESGDIQSIKQHKLKIHEFITWCVKVFGKDKFFIELQPALSEEQIYCNKKLADIANGYGLKMIVTTDAHFLRPEDRAIHQAFLNAKDGEREVDSFYEACFVQNVDEIHERMDYMDEEIINEAIENTLLIGEMIEDYTIEHEPIIPKMELPQFKLRHLFKPAYNEYEYIKKMSESKDEQDRYLLKLIEDGFDDKLKTNELTKEAFHKILNRINVELGELWEISQKLNQSMPSYYITVREIINIIWDDECGGDSLVGAARGSAAGYLVNYLLDNTQFNPMQYDLPHWRHIHKSRPDLPDIDIDTEGSKRQKILKALRKRFGDKRVLQIATFGTEGSKSALKTACRGLGIDKDISEYLSGMIPYERGSNWPLTHCFYGDKETNRKPMKEFIREVEQYPNLKETALKIEGLTNKRSSHAAGVIIFNNEYTKSNAMMKTPKGAFITQFNMGDSEAMGSVKFDLLTIEALDKIRVTLDQLIENKEIEWQGNLKETYKKYIHPDVIEYEDPRLWEMAGNGEVMDLFQFSTEVGHQSVIKVKPKSLLEAAVTNSLMRLMSDGEEQPVDTYVKYKNNMSLWYEEMRNYGLSNAGIKVVERYLKDIYGVADTQEVVMQMVMDKDIAGFDIKESNYLRKSIAKKKEDVLKEVQRLFFKKGKEVGASDALLNYVWNVQFKRQFGYSFSLLHTLAYSIIALQELNLNYRYNPLYWNTACLTVNSGGVENEEETEGKDGNKKTQKTDYGKVASAIGSIRHRGIKVDLPDVNKAGFGFKADIQNNSIIFGMKGMNGIGDEIVHRIIANRPYESFEEFLDKLFYTGKIKKGQVIQLIKGGCFDTFDDRKEIMKKYITIIAEPKKKLTMANIGMMLENDLIPEQFTLEIRCFKFKEYISKKVFKTIESPNDKLYLLDDAASEFFNQNFDENCVVDFHNEHLIISENAFKKEYDKKMIALKKWLGTDEALNLLNRRLLNNEWIKYASGTYGKWEMDSLSYYYNDHELSGINFEKYGIADFYELPEEPIKGKPYQWRGRTLYEYGTTRIAGTVLDRDKNKHTITLLTPTGVVTVKQWAGSFGHYNKQISRPVAGGKKEVVEKSWYTRGTLLMFTGFRRGNNFIPKVYKNSIYSHTVCRIDHVDSEGNIRLTTKRAEV
ncbi:DNA polymerase III subunit alpha [Bacillus amyloliquefaciens]|uniref:DNA polymerase III subunit alpha n=1 Tax=Bacillus amyloliquefaciens group TaxID=1938374 RepID=UPI000DEAF004|nr:MULTISPECIES: DNA polymerase III subunit alpha [Bacillus amyloliquefaciens group]MDE5154272.1 DNA polymerase III subunit alpha [Bacillus amyloliquefaciens]RBY99973.1 DNA polymerase III subunit alpha [Bacillus velezensis]